MVNFFAGFRKFNERAPMPGQQSSGFHDRNRLSNQQAPGVMNMLKKTQRVPKELWKGMPFNIPARRYIELEGRKFWGPMYFSVEEFDHATVTIKVINNPMDFPNADDIDDEIDLDNNNDGDQKTFTITRNVFDHLQNPENFQGADYATASQTTKAGGI